MVRCLHPLNCLEGAFLYHRIGSQTWKDSCIAIDLEPCAYLRQHVLPIPQEQSRKTEEVKQP